ncbi:acyl-CoA dehydrogenase family protein [Streptomyces sp. NBC_00056]|uniref:acyl-CoA dehydrogenase n=1 Tax=unclassified Streptomyces TaxID=2593676 RepID=UPI00224E648C|nr:MULTISPECIES: acyl-CoA dehydrogenase family protein [unclassified Streptomyces]MCX5437024.1 acyl-CoA dehydrogenase family protein [Streptomyces sp. NBC_00063]WUB96335.1 acyl-CoA dehydrogenase family protein [Streptomyces sp. NBC_00569]
MGIAITQEQEELSDAVRGWLARAVPPEEVRKLLDAPAVAAGRPAHWDGLAGQGLLGLHLPEEYGGGGGDLVDLAVVLEEAGRAALPGPFAANAAASLVLRHAGSAGLAASLASGDRIGAVALGTGTLTAVTVSDGLVLDGVAPPVLSGGDADLLLLAAESATGTVWVAVDTDTAGLSSRVHESADPTRPTAEITARGALVPGARILAVDTATVRDLASVVLAADACGVAAWALHTAAEYAKVREQFGRPIGQFQGIKHLCADMLVRVEQARALVWDAARAAGEGRTGAETEEGEAGAGVPGSVEGPDGGAARELAVALAVGAALDAAYSCAKDCVQVLGGIGFTWEHDAHLYLRRAVVARQLLGAGDAHRLRAVRLAEGGARRELRLELPAEAETFRVRAREAVEGLHGLDPAAARRALAPTGYAAPHLPEPYGLGAGPVQQLAVQQELAAAGVRVSDLGIGTWVVPSLLAYGTPEQRDRYLLPTLRGDVLWCQLFSEPGAGSDLASLRTKAERTEDGRWRVNGQKVWTSAAQWADHGILLARTDPDAPKHKGLTYFVVDMKRTEGIDVRPLKEITGDSLFNEVYFDDVLLPEDAVVGQVDDGWRVARNTLGNERVHMADQLTFDTGLEALIARAGTLDGAYRARIGALATEAHALACIGLRTTMRQVAGAEPGPGASVRKLVQTPHQQKVAELALELLGPEGALREGAGERALHGFLMSRCLTIAGGTTQVQLNVVAERILGLPRD